MPWWWQPRLLLKVIQNYLIYKIQFYKTSTTNNVQEYPGDASILISTLIQSFTSCWKDNHGLKLSRRIENVRLRIRSPRVYAATKRASVKNSEEWGRKHIIDLRSARRHVSQLLPCPAPVDAVPETLRKFLLFCAIFFFIIPQLLGGRECLGTVDRLRVFGKGDELY